MGDDLDTATGQVRRHRAPSLPVLEALGRFPPENTEQLENPRGREDRHDQ